MSWQIFILISVFTFSLSTLLQRALLKAGESRPVTYAVFFTFLTGVLVGLFGWASGNLSLGSEFFKLWPNLILSLLFYTVANICIFKSLKETEASSFTIIFSARAIFTITASTIFIKETLSGGEFLGAGLILAAIVLTNWNGGGRILNKGTLLALIAAGGFGLGNTNDRYILKSVNLYPYLTLAFLGPALFMAALYRKEIGQVRNFLRKDIFLKILLLSFVYAVSSITFFAALKIGQNSSQVAVVNLTSVVITVLLSIIFLKEREHWLRKLLGAILSFMGLMLIGS